MANFLVKRRDKKACSPQKTCVGAYFYPINQYNACKKKKGRLAKWTAALQQTYFFGLTRIQISDQHLSFSP